MLIDPYHASIIINMSSDYFFKYCCKGDPDFVLSADVNLQMNTETKSKIVSGVVGHFEREINLFERKYYHIFREQKFEQRRALIRKTH
jgi:hypothetical protein